MGKSHHRDRFPLKESPPCAKSTFERLPTLIFYGWVQANSNQRFVCSIRELRGMRGTSNANKPYDYRTESSAQFDGRQPIAAILGAETTSHGQLLLRGTASG